jgi:hypothetical protein
VLVLGRFLFVLEEVGTHHHGIPAITAWVAAQEGEAEGSLDDDIFTVPQLVAVLYIVAFECV